MDSELNGDNCPKTPTNAQQQSGDAIIGGLGVVMEDNIPSPEAHHHKQNSDLDLQNTSKFDGSSLASSTNTMLPRPYTNRVTNRQDSAASQIGDSLNSRASLDDLKMSAPQTSPRANHGNVSSGVRFIAEESDSVVRHKSEMLCWGILGTVLLSLIVMSLLLVKHSEEFVLYVQGRAKVGVSGYLLIFFLTLLGTQPMFPGLTFLYVLAGFLLGWLGFPVLYCSTVLGGWATFLISKQLVKRGYLSWRAVYIRFTSYETYIRAVERAVSDQSYKAAVLLQLSGSPYGLLNMLLALSKITFWQFVIATLISRLKLIQYILLGTILKTVAELSSFTSGNLSNPSYLIITGISFVVSTIAVFYVYYYAKKELKLMRPRPPTVVSILDTDAMPPRPTSQ
eukprot:TRINITY_DN5112_c0_g1_i2.p1 TRINITY_DN5112_c0_g1~~TRINITY_DN5112_c0_g1_i2.p1  ORF type:complete len:437 (+),score=32.94 TRINITY_DN5112_c0_g1_i2:128-1312(+)